MTVVTALAAMVTAGAQDQRLSLPGSRMSVSNIFQEIRRQTHLGVAYRTDQIDPERIVALPTTELSLEKVIELVANGGDIKGVIDGNVIVFVKNNPVPVPRASTGGFKPTPLSEFRESLGLRPRSVVLDNQSERIVLQEQLVEIELPMETHLLPTADYGSNEGMLPRFAIKTNLLYDFGVFFTPNLAVEFGLGKKTSIELAVSYNWKGAKQKRENVERGYNKKLVHMIVRPEFRYWLCERFNGHFFGGDLLYARYNIDGHRVPSLLGREPLLDKNFRYNGHALGLGVTYGYNWAFHKRWGAEFSVGMGAARLWYDRFECGPCNRDADPGAKWYFGPTNASVSIVFLIK